MLLIGIHLYLVRKHGVSANRDDTARKKRFFPEQVFKDTVAVFIGFIVLVLLAALAKLPLEKIADPTDTSYIPRPEWYFLFLFQMLKFFNGSLEVIGAVILPGLAVLALFLVPFLDRGPAVRLAKGTMAIGVALIAILGGAGMTGGAVITTPERSTETAESQEPT